MKQNDTLCSIATTLYPSYLERLTSPASNEFLETHAKECPHCQKFLHIPGNMHDSVATAPMYPAVDTAANLAESSYLRRYRRLFFATVSGVFLGILLFALLLANMIYGANHLFKIAINQKTTRTESASDYGEWKSYAGISDFSIFPGNLSGCETVDDYYYRCDSSSFSTALQLYLDCTYTPKNYEIEKKRLQSIAQTDNGQSLFARSACYTMLFYDTACEYAIFLEEEHRILYISLQNIARDEIVFDEKYLPLDYGNFGAPPENQAEPYCQYKKN